MPHLPQKNDPIEWHRYFAMEANNQAWALAVKTRSAAEDLEMQNAAHAAAYHWDQVGTELHHIRAKMLLAEVDALCHRGESALALANEVRDYFLANECPDWEMAFVHTIHAHAAAAAAETSTHAKSYEAAIQALAAIESEEERKIVIQTFELVPRP